MTCSVETFQRIVCEDGTWTVGPDSSGWHPTTVNTRKFYLDAAGNRISAYQDGQTRKKGLTLGGVAELQRWEHWICEDPLEQMTAAGWERTAIPNKTYRSGAQAYKWTRKTTQTCLFA